MSVQPNFYIWRGERLPRYIIAQRMGIASKTLEYRLRVWGIQREEEIPEWVFTRNRRKRVASSEDLLHPFIPGWTKPLKEELDEMKKTRKHISELSYMNPTKYERKHFMKEDDNANV